MYLDALLCLGSTLRLSASGACWSPGVVSTVLALLKQTISESYCCGLIHWSLFSVDESVHTDTHL